ncbi:Cu(2+)-transporting P-type ATPase [Friedmanniomyces endolithicus]|uniref:P-type Cu(+) transporter n=2 Tax=Friedmanniomyces endolithicus TaxID=329885 RepID=A0AAN6HCL5_9PEZI|nr:Cu(2+)-transporting P-type ATPase [Friedmanniomyces endolithicus]KAK0863406.1 Cu(2+)-transporting P-type ATPase [Friedmanniomyces endolithicus]KAK0883496.1 Cu(2+)-transporting P-type ATPase [Friedmanniomyces endolithicus]KAK0931848.1 Cu(2+)-transporting P-type ATPase [Friedmanniomyces endolithicus]KAK0957026.1 Cu(2+)-transporting P-type ATPase [Friedmanniomyces endolithicus]
MAPSRAAHMTTTTLKVTGMTCGACTSSVEAGFSGVEGVGSVSVSLVMERTVIIHDAETIDALQLRDIVEDRGFDAEVLGSSDRPISPLFDAEDEAEAEDVETDEQILGSGMSTTTLHVGGMTCGACTSAVEGAFKDVAGIKGFSISLLSERAVIEHDASLISAEKLAETIEDTGFDAEVLDTQAAQHIASKPKSRRKATGSKLVTTTVAIEGMTCGACTSAIESGFKDIEGMAQFNVSLLAERAVILHDPAKLSTVQIAETIEDRGFDATILSSQEEGVQTSSTTTTVQLKIYGLPSPEAAADLQADLQSTSGIVSANINFATTRASITHTPSQLGLRAIVEAVEKAGYNALVADSDDNNAQLESLAKTKEIQEWYRAFKTSLAFAIPVFLISMVFPMCIPVLDIGRYNAFGIWLGDIICISLTIPVQFGIGRRFYVSAYKSLRHGSPTMDVLVVLGTSAAFFFSCAAMLVSFFTPPHSRPATTFDTSTMLITFILLGRFLENRAKGQTSKALSRLMSLAPSTAVIYTDAIAAVKAAEGWEATKGQDGEKLSTNEKASDPSMSISEKTVPTELLEVGDIVLLKPGDKIPADGLVTRGESYVDESMVTGEAMPILKKTGSTLMAGTVNGAGRVDFRVTRAGRDTQLSQIVRLVQEAQTSRAPIQRMADRVAGWFVPIIIILGVSTFIAWMALSHLVPPAHLPKIFLSEASGGKLMVCVKLCIAVIVFACPCALGLATPTAVMVGTGVGAEQGILVKGGATLETATRVRWVVMDKTGTLTRGKMSISGAEIIGEWDQGESARRLWWAIVGLAEGGSEHPIAKAITAGAKAKLGVPIDGTLEGGVGDFKAVVGKGLEATVEPADALGRQRYQVVIGNASLLRGHGIKMPTSTEDEDGELSRRNSRTVAATYSKAGESAGITTIHIAIDNTYAGSLALSDTLKPSARACIAALHSMGITTSLVTGDQAPTALHVAALVGIPAANVHAGVLPSGKRSIIEDLQRRGEIVAMVGDGINDSPALATAHVGISLASGTDVAMEAADIVLMKPEQLLDIPASLHLSRTIFRRIKYNLLLSCVYNAVGLPIAMGFLLPWGITLPPLAAGAAMACSSVTVVVSSLLLKFWRRPRWMVEGEEALLAAELGKGRRGSWVQGQGMWSRVARVKNAVWGRRRNMAEGERGAYVPLETYEAV